MTRVTRYATAREAAVQYGISTRTLARLRANGTGPAWERIGRSIRYPISVIPGTITVLSENPLGAPGDVLPDPHAPWRVLVESQRLEPANDGDEAAYLSTLRIASTAERDRALTGYRRLLAAIRADRNDQTGVA